MTHRARIRAKRRRQHHQGRPGGPEAAAMVLSWQMRDHGSAVWYRVARIVYARRRHHLFPTVLVRFTDSAMSFPFKQSRKPGGIPPVAIVTMDQPGAQAHHYAMTVEGGTRAWWPFVKRAR